jgi:ABC-type bacteriocin/lantibiotic exporter with double-glycine peptidase domain
VPLVLQASNAERGLACLAMILGYFVDETSVRELWEPFLLTARGRPGSHAAVIATQTA